MTTIYVDAYGNEDGSHLVYRQFDCLDEAENFLNQVQCLGGSRLEADDEFVYCVVSEGTLDEIEEELSAEGYTLEPVY